MNKKLTDYYKKLIKVLDKPLLFLVIIVTFGFLVRLYKINTPIADWHSWRQADTASVTRIFMEEGVDLLHPKYYDTSSIQTSYINPEGWRMVEFPVFNLMHLLIAKVPSVDFNAAGRLVSIFSALVTALFLYKIGNKTISKWGGVLASFFYLFIPFNIYFTRVILPEPMIVMFAVVSLWYFLQFNETKSYKHLFVSASSFALALLLKPYILFFAIPMAVVFFATHKFKELRNIDLIYKFTLYAFITLLPLILWRIWVNYYPVGIPHFKWAFNGDGIRFRPAFWRWIFAERIGRLILGYWGLVILGFGLIKVNKKNVVNISLFAGSIIYTIVVATANVRHDYYQIFLIPGICLILAQGAHELWQNKLYSAWVSKPLVIFSVGMMLLIGTYLIRDNYQINKPEILEAGEAVKRLTPKSARVIAPYNGDTAFLYQTNRYGWPVVDSSLETLVNERGADYFVSVDLNSADTLFVEENYQVVEKTDSYIIANLNNPK